MKVKIDSLIPTYDRESNPNKMDPERYTLLVMNIKENGFLQPILVVKSGDKYRIVDGHHRWWGAQDAGLTEVLVVEADLKNKETAVGLAMNVLRGEQDLTLVSEMMKDMLIENGWEVDFLSITTGYTTDEINSLIATVPALSENILEGGGSAQDESEAPHKPFILEIAFAGKEEFQLVKRKLKKAAGKGNDLSVGLMNVLGELNK